jgi:hypothetical protein
MTAALKLGLASPLPMAAIATSATFNTFNPNDNTKGYAYAFQPVEDVTITHLGFRYSQRVGTPPTYRISLQAINSSGVPSGTVLGGGTPASATFTPPADTTWNGLWKWIALDNSYAATRGQWLCSCIEYSSGTADGSNFGQFNTNQASFGLGTALIFPWAATVTSGSWTKLNTGWPLVGYRTASSRYGHVIQSGYSTATAATNGRRVAQAFTAPTGWGSTFKVAGMRWWGSIPSGGTLKMGLWDATTELQAIQIDSDYATGTQAHAKEMYFDESSLTALSFGTKYYIGLEVDASIAVSILGFTCAEADDLAAWPGGTDFYLSTYNGSAWSDDTATRLMVEPILADWTEPAGGGGGMLVHPGFSGGFNG